MRHFDFLPLRTLALQKLECSVGMQESFKNWEDMALSSDVYTQLNELGLSYYLYLFEINSERRETTLNHDYGDWVMARWVRVSDDKIKLDKHQVPVIEFSSDKDFIVAKMRFT
jgi:hypothetical protein